MLLALAKLLAIVGIQSLDDGLLTRAKLYLPRTCLFGAFGLLLNAHVRCSALSFKLLPTGLRWLRFATAICLAVAFLELRIEIIEQFLPVDELDVFEARNEVCVVAVLALRVSIFQHTQLLCHLIGIVLQIAPFKVCLEHDFDAFA